MNESQIYKLKTEYNLNYFKSKALWFTGLSGSGKSTLASNMKQQLINLGMNTILLDGDVIRKGLCKDLGFSKEDRSENIRRISEVTKLFIDADFIVIVAFISPYLKDRQLARDCIGQDKFIEIYCAASLEICEKRDPKGLYKKAREGVIKEFTGISSPYEPPLSPEIKIDTSLFTVDESVNHIFQVCQQKKSIHKHNSDGLSLSEIGEIDVLVN